MKDIPKFVLYGQDDPEVENVLQPALELRRWNDLSSDERNIIFAEIANNGWFNDDSQEILKTIRYLNKEYLRQLPGKRLHSMERTHGDHLFDLVRGARTDFVEIMLREESEEMVLRTLSYFMYAHIDQHAYGVATGTTKKKDRDEWIDRVFRRFDLLANCLNHVFEQFSINQLVTRNGFVPRQDEKISKEIYAPVLGVLADPKWKHLSDDLAKMFQDYREQKYPETITKAHGAVQRFLQILVGEEGRSGKGEVAKLFQEAKDRGLVPINRFTEPLISVIQGYIASERATNSTAKPALKDATNSDALLMMNVIMLFLQYCLQNVN